MAPTDRDTGTQTNKEYAQSQNTISKAFSCLYLSERIAKLEMTEYKRLTRSAKHEPTANTTKIVSEYGQEVSQSQASDKRMVL